MASDEILKISASTLAFFTDWFTFVNIIFLFVVFFIPD